MQDQDKDFEEFDDADFMDDDMDFGDESDYLDDADGMEAEEWDDETLDELDAEFAEEEEENEKPKKPKKKLSTNTLVILGAVVVGAGFMVWTLAKPPEDQLPKEMPFQSALSPQGQVNNPVTVPAKQAQQERIVKENQTQEGGFLKNPSAIDNIQATKDNDANPDMDDIMGDAEPPMPAPIATNTQDSLGGLTPMPDFGEGPMEEDIAQDDGFGADLPIPRAPEPEDAMPMEDDVPSAAEFLEQKLAERQNDDMAVLPDALTDGPDAEEMPMDEAPVVEPESEPVMETPEPPMPEKTAMDIPPAPSVPVGEVESLKDELESTQVELSNLRESSSSEIASLNAEIERLKEELSKKPKEVVKEVIKTAPAPKAVQKKTTRRSKPRVAKKKSWELRAAMPGKAWVSEAGNTEMRSVVVGDSLSGIGRVTSITYNNGIWIVEGTQGSIKQ